MNSGGRSVGGAAGGGAFPHGATALGGPRASSWFLHDHNQTPRSVGLLWMTDQPNTTLTRDHPAGFEPATPASERPQFLFLITNLGKT